MINAGVIEAKPQIEATAGADSSNFNRIAAFLHSEKFDKMKLLDNIKLN